MEFHKTSTITFDWWDDKQNQRHQVDMNIDILKKVFVFQVKWLATNIMLLRNIGGPS